MVYITCLTFKAQINQIWFLEEFKMNEILCVATFDTIYTSNFDTKCVHYNMETPRVFLKVVNWHKLKFTLHKTLKALTSSNKVLMNYTKVPTTCNIVQNDNNEI
jgi:hypothetical protein